MNNEGMFFKIKTERPGFIKVLLIGVKTKEVKGELEVPVKLAIALGNSILRKSKHLLREGEFVRTFDKGRRDYE